MSSYKLIAEINEKKKTYPHMYNLNSDPQMTGRIIHFLVKSDSTMDDETIIGNGKAEGTDLTLRGSSITDMHCKIMHKDGVFTLETFPNARTLRNGKPVTAETKVLKNNDRLLFGTSQFYVFCNPKDTTPSKVTDPTFEMAQAEIAEKSGGFDMSGNNKSRDESLLQQDLIEIMPGVEEANSISEALGKQRRFDLVIVSPEARGEMTGRTEVMVKMTDIETKHEWFWNRQKFLDRKCLMSELFDKFEDGVDVNVPQDKDPFYDDPKADFHIGSVKMWLQSISYMLESSETLDITDFKGSSVGKMAIGAYPCDAKGKEYTEKDNKFVEDPSKLVGVPVDFKVKILNARGLPNRFTDVYCKYKVYLEEGFTQSKVMKDTINPDFNHERVISLGAGTPEIVEFLKTGAFTVQIWGKQKDMKPKGGKGGKVLVPKTSTVVPGGTIHAVNDNVKRFDPEKVKIMMEVTALKKRQEKMEQKLAHMQKMIAVAEEHNKRKLRTALIKDIYVAPTNDQAEKCIKLIPLEQDSDDEDGGGIVGGSKVVGVVIPQNKQDISGGEADKGGVDGKGTKGGKKGGDGNKNSDEESKKKKDKGHKGPDSDDDSKKKEVKGHNGGRRGSHSSDSEDESKKKKAPPSHKGGRSGSHSSDSEDESKKKKAPPKKSSACVLL
ncbi:hypothetical protein DPMN_076116 [Dreissena polymorpha]|uniref:C2 domain-containing protein n=1 Tax=Dreissena polymorpha TaxID=45954 RepID=A0A9D4BQ72_DREPO|nr:hypothetical protein DPMN_076116 [Dreissena polymorpha]